MADLSGFYSTWSPRLLSVLRIVAAFLFTQHGTQKILGFPLRQEAQWTAPEMFSLTWFAGILELFGGILLLAGLFTRPVAFILSGQMAVAYFLRHAGDGFWTILNRGELAALYCFLFLYLSVVGGGNWSLDWLWRSKGQTQGQKLQTEP
jgi:putative oxidoreductase